MWSGTHVFRTQYERFLSMSYYNWRALVRLFTRAQRISISRLLVLLFDSIIIIIINLSLKFNGRWLSRVRVQLTQMIEIDCVTVTMCISLSSDAAFRLISNTRVIEINFVRNAMNGSYTHSILMLHFRPQSLIGALSSRWFYRLLVEGKERIDYWNDSKRMGMSASLSDS